MEYSYRRLSAVDVPQLKEVLNLFAEVFNEPDTYGGAVPSDEYLRRLLAKPYFIALTAMSDDDVVGALAAYELEKFEQDRREIYIYDLAVSERHRRKGVAKSLISELKRIAKQRKAYVIFVQADPPDTAAIRLYESLGTKEEVYHFDISVAD